ncbi:MAG: glycosyltransferase family 4 protein [Alphaproteobacteria bacterium]|nr:glycosyltransferase family 4 protein [Alphaproteobacteria bacterium]
MKIAVDVLFQSPTHSTGALSWFTQFARAAPGRDPANTYVYVAGRDDAAYYRQKNPALHVEGAGWGNRRRILRILSEHFLLGPALKRLGADILFHGSSGVAPLVMPRRTKLILAIWGMQHVAAADIRWEQRLYRRLLFRPGLRRADAILVNSAYTRDLLLKHYGGGIRAPVEVVHHGVDFNLFRPGPLTQDEMAPLASRGVNGPYILFVGQLYPYKLLHILAEAFARAAASRDLPHKLVVVGSFSRTDSMGEAYREQVLKGIADAGLSDRLVALEDVGIQDLRALYAGTDLYVQSSAAETFGRTVIEAMACGAPVLAARAGATPEILADAGRYYEAQDVEGCAAEIAAILQDQDLRAQLRAKGLQRAKDFSYDGELDHLIGIFHRVGSDQRLP